MKLKIINKDKYMIRKKKNIFIIFSIIFLLIGILCLSCSDSENSDGEGSGGVEGDVILPLTIGNTWSHTYTTELVSTPPYVLTTSVLGIQNISGEDTYKTGTSALYNYFQNHEDGLYMYGNQMEIFPASCLFIKYPCSLGDTWDFNGGKYRVLGMSLAWTVDAGTFECIEYYYRKINEDGTLCEHYEYWSPGVGQIDQEVLLNGELLLTIKLNSYSLD